MRLTKLDKECFVDSVMGDVPQIDYDEQAAAICMAWAIERLPAEVAVVYKKFPGWIEARQLSTPRGLNSTYVPMLERMWNTSDDQPELWAKLVPLSEAAQAQCEARRELKSKVMAAIYGCSTLKQAQDRLPEFKKYLPEDCNGTSTANLPATANLVTELMAAGWPKASNSATMSEAA